MAAMMQDMADGQMWAVGAVFVLAGGVKGITGMGLPTVAMSLLGLWMAPAPAAALLVAPSLLTNLAQCRGPAGWRLARLLWPAWLAMVLVIAAAPGLSMAAAGAGSGVTAQRLLGAVLVLYGGWGLWRPRLPVLPQTAWRGGLTGVSMGAATGFMTAVTGVFVMPLVPYLQALRLDKETMVQALGLSFSVATLALGLRLGTTPGLSLWSPASALALVAAFVGLGCGARVRRRISQPMFQRTLFLVFIGLGLANLWQGR